MAKAGIAPDLVERLVELSEAGVPARIVCRRLSLPRSTVDYHRLSAGILTRNSKAPGKVYQRAGRQVRPFSADEDRQLEKLRMDGLSIKKIATVIDRHPSSIFMRLKTLARRQEAEAA